MNKLLRPKKIKIVEVGPRDGLQNEKKIIKSTEKAKLIKMLFNAGCEEVEAGSFVRADKIPQMADVNNLIGELKKLNIDLSKCTFLVPNLQGLERAYNLGITKIAVFTATSETFNKKNINASIDESLKRIEELAKVAVTYKIEMRGYISTVFGCPYEGIKEGQNYLKFLTDLARQLFAIKINEISFGDTIGVAHPDQVEEFSSHLLEKFGNKKIALHFHDTRGMAITNILTALNLGVEIFDSSLGGLGGCPYAKGATGNVATEDLLNLFNNLKVESGLDLKKYAEASKFILNELEKETTSKFLLNYFKA